MRIRSWACAIVALTLGWVATPAQANHTGVEAVGGNDAHFLDSSRDAEHVFYDRPGFNAIFHWVDGVTTQVPAGVAPRFEDASADGGRVIFSTAQRLSAADTDSRTDVYESSGGVSTLLSIGSSGGNGAVDAEFRGANADATHVYFTTTERLEPADTDGARDLYERAGGTTSVLSVTPFGGNATGSANFGASSADGSRVFFTTSDQLTSDDMDATPDVYEYAGGTVTRISTGEIGGNGDFIVLFRAVTPDGSKVFFQTQEQLTLDDLDDDNRDLYVREGSTTTLVSTGPLPPAATIASFRGASEDGTRVFFETSEPLLVEDQDVNRDLYERSGGTTTLLSQGPTGGNGDANVSFAGMSADGSHVFYTTAEQLVADDADGGIDVYEYAGGVTSLVSTGPQVDASLNAKFEGNSADGQRAFFSTNLLYERTGGQTYVMPVNGRVLAVSPDGDRVVIFGFVSPGSGLFVAVAGPYARPKGATPIRASLVPAYAECTSPNSVHGPSLEFGSCAPPAQASGNLTVGTPDANGASPNSMGFVRLDAIPGATGPPNDADVGITVSLSDVRCKAGVTPCGPTNGTGGDDYAGELRATSEIRITDRLGGSTATVQDIPFPVTVPCDASPAIDRGGLCAVTTSANTVVPGAVQEGQRAIVQLGQIQIFDGGPDGDVDTAGDDLFAVQGVFVP